MAEFIEILNKILTCYNLLLIVASILLNPLVCLICLRSKELRKTSTFKLLAIGAINDIFVCFPWNQENFTNAFFDFQSPRRSLFYCRYISFFLGFATLEFQSWILVSISFDRYLSLRVKKWSKHYFKGLRPVALACLLLLFVVSLNIGGILYTGYSYIENGTEIIVCYATSENNFYWFILESQVNSF
jgi:hypothetical protein